MIKLKTVKSNIFWRGWLSFDVTKDNSILFKYRTAPKFMKCEKKIIINVIGYSKKYFLLKQ